MMNRISPQEMQAAIELINRSQRILLVSHRRPDGDTLGATSALLLALRGVGKSTTPACIDEVSPRLRFIPETGSYLRSFHYNDYDLIIISDAGASHMTGFHERYPEFLSKRVPILNIDHHASNDGFGTVNLVDAQASSATMIVWKLLKDMNLPITRDIALSLLAGIYNDTGGMMHSNTTQETYAIAADLMSHGIDISEIVRPMFKQSSFGQLKLWGHILENLHKNDKGVVSAVVSEEDLRMLDARGSDTGGIVDLMNTVPDAHYTLLLAEEDGMVKGSLRTQREDVNVSDIAGQFGGGGHKKASGFRMHGRLQKQISWKIVAKENVSR